MAQHDSHIHHHRHCLIISILVLLMICVSTSETLFVNGHKEEKLNNLPSSYVILGSTSSGQSFVNGSTTFEKLKPSTKYTLCKGCYVRLNVTGLLRGDAQMKEVYVTSWYPNESNELLLEYSFAKEGPFVSSGTTVIEPSSTIIVQVAIPDNLQSNKFIPLYMDVKCLGEECSFAIAVQDNVAITVGAVIGSILGAIILVIVGLMAIVIWLRIYSPKYRDEDTAKLTSKI